MNIKQMIKDYAPIFILIACLGAGGEDIKLVEKRTAVEIEEVKEVKEEVAKSPYKTFLYKSPYQVSNIFKTPYKKVEYPKVKNKKLLNLAIKKAKKHKINPVIFARQINQESGYNIYAVSPVGAKGIAQFMPSTGRRYGLKNENDFYNPDKALDASARLMRDNLKVSNGDYKMALSLYNSGRKDGYKRFNETKQYVKNIMGV